MSAANLPSLVQRFFTQRLLEQQGLSPHTVASYRDTFRLLLAFAAQHVGRAPSNLQMEELDVSFIEKFLRHLEQDRGNSVRTRNTPSSSSSRPGSRRWACNVSESLRFLRNAVNTVRSSFSPRTRPQPSWQHLMHAHGSATGIERCFLLRFKQACATAN